jgi:hypothetical protein
MTGWHFWKALAEAMYEERQIKNQSGQARHYGEPESNEPAAIKSAIGDVEESIS